MFLPHNLTEVMMSMTANTHAQVAAQIKASDPTYPKDVYSPGKMVATVATAAELAALGPGWFTYRVSA